MGEVSPFIGRFHPLIVHFPIGILVLAFLFELLSRTKRFKKVKFAIAPALLIGSLGAFASALSGYLLSQEGGYEEILLRNHQWLGIATAVFSLLVYIFHRRTFLLKEKHRKPVRMIVFLPLMLLLVFTGHLGGSLTHGEDFLMPDWKVEPQLSTQANFTADSNFYKSIILPLLEKKCYSCHSSKKQKGQLRLDQAAYILKGGKHGTIIKAGFPNESELYKRMILPLEDEHHMAPKGREQLTNSEIDLLYGWIETGARFEEKISEQTNAKILAYLSVLKESAPLQLLDETVIPELDEALITRLRAMAIRVIPVAKNSKYVKAFFVNPKTITDKEIELLKPFSEQLISLKLTNTAISNQAIKTVSTFKNLRILQLDYTGITDESLSLLNALTKLEQLNLVETTTTDKGILSLASHSSLKKIYLFNTKVTKLGLADFHTKNGGVILDTGNYKLSVLTSDTIVHKRK